MQGGETEEGVSQCAWCRIKTNYSTSVCVHVRGMYGIISNVQTNVYILHTKTRSWALLLFALKSLATIKNGLFVLHIEIRQN